MWSTGYTLRLRQEFGPIIDEYFRTTGQHPPEIKLTASGRAKPSAADLRKLIDNEKTKIAEPSAAITGSVAPRARARSVDTRRRPSASSSSRTSGQLSKSLRHGLDLRSPSHSTQPRTRKRSHRDDKKEEPREKRRPPSHGETTSTGSSAEKDNHQLRRPMSIVSVVKREIQTPSTSTPIRTTSNARSSSLPRPRQPKIEGLTTDPELYYGLAPSAVATRHGSTSEDEDRQPSTSRRSDEMCLDH